MLTRIARSYITAVAGAGAIVLGTALHELHIADPALFSILALLSLIGAGLKIRVPGVNGNVSLSFLPMILGSVLLSWPEAVLIAATATLAQATVFAKKFKAVQAAFNCGAIILSIASACVAGRVVAEQHVPLIQLALAGCVFYVTNSVIVTTVIGLAENKAVQEIWNDCCRLYLPYFGAGLACALVAFSGATPDERRTMQHPGLVLLPVMLLTRHYFKTFLARTAVR